MAQKLESSVFPMFINYSYDNLLSLQGRCASKNTWKRLIKKRYNLVYLWDPFGRKQCGLNVFYYSGQDSQWRWREVKSLWWDEDQHRASWQSRNTKQRQTLDVLSSCLQDLSTRPSPCIALPLPAVCLQVPMRTASRTPWHQRESGAARGKICISSRWAAETPPEKPGIHRDKPITSSELIIAQHQHNTNISPDTDTSLPLTVFSPQSFLNLTNWHKIWLLFVSNWAGALVLVDITAYLPQIHVMLCFSCQV